MLIICSIIACSRENALVREKPTGESLAKDQNFQNIVKLLNKSLNHSKDYNSLNQLLKSPSKNNNQIIQNLGFENEEDFDDFRKKIDSLNNNLEEEFDFSQMSNDQKEELVQQAVHYLTYNFDLLEGGGDGGGYCEQSLAACKQSAYATFIMSSTGCIAGGVGIAMGSAGWAAPVGGALAGACVAAAQVQYDASVKTCMLSYSNCKKEESSTHD